MLLNEKSELYCGVVSLLWTMNFVIDVYCSNDYESSIKFVSGHQLPFIDTVGIWLQHVSLDMSIMTWTEADIIREAELVVQRNNVTCDLRNHLVLIVAVIRAGNYLVWEGVLSRSSPVSALQEGTLLGVRRGSHSSWASLLVFITTWRVVYEWFS